MPLLLMLALVGAFAGVMAGLLGVGGGIILVPAFYFTFTALGYASAQLMQICLATFNVTSIRTAHAHQKRRAIDWNVLNTSAPRIVGVLGIIVGQILGWGVKTGGLA